MGVERIDYSSDEEYQQALQSETEQERQWFEEGQAIRAQEEKLSETCGELRRVVSAFRPAVESFDGESPAQIKWKKDWLAKAEDVLSRDMSPSLASGSAELVDGAYNVVELSKSLSEEDKKSRLEEARRLVPGCDSLWI
jgi:hypothetical protein